MPRVLRRLIVIGLGALTALALAGCFGPSAKSPSVIAQTQRPKADSTWSSRWHDARQTSCSAVVGPSAPRLKWKLANANGSEPSIGPDGTLVFSGVDGAPCAIDPSDGSIKWRLDGMDGPGGTPAVLSDGRAVITGVDSGVTRRPYVFVVDATGKLLWRTWLGSGLIDTEGDRVSVSSPTIGSDGIAYVAANLADPKNPSGAVYAIDASGEAIKWASRVSGAEFRTPVLGPDGTVYAPDDRGHRLYAIGPDGATRWVIPARCDSSDPAVGGDGTIYLLALTDRGTSPRMDLEAIRPDGTVEWRTPTDGQGTVAIGPNGTLYVVGQRLHAITSAGQEAWSVESASFVPAIVDGAGTVYLHDADSLRAINRDGTEKWRIRVGDPAESSPVIGNDGTVYVSVSNEEADLVAVGSASSAMKP